MNNKATASPALQDVNLHVPDFVAFYLRDPFQTAFVFRQWINYSGSP